MPHPPPRTTLGRVNAALHSRRLLWRQPTKEPEVVT